MKLPPFTTSLLLHERDEVRQGYGAETFWNVFSISPPNSSTGLHLFADVVFTAGRSPDRPILILLCIEQRKSRKLERAARNAIQTLKTCGFIQWLYFIVHPEFPELEISEFGNSCNDFNDSGHSGILKSESGMSVIPDYFRISGVVVQHWVYKWVNRSFWSRSTFSVLRHNIYKNVLNCPQRR